MSAPAPTAGGGLRRGGRRLLIVAAMTVVIAGLVAMVGWRFVAADARDDVTVAWTGPVTCTGTKVVEWTPEPGAGTFPVVRLREGMRCVLPVSVANGGRLAVDVTRVRLPYMGPGGGAAVQVPRLAGQAPIRPASVDAVFGLDERLAPGERLDLEIVFRFRPDGCDSPGATMWLAGQMPQVRVLALGRPGTRTPEETIGFRGTPESSCDS